MLTGIILAVLGLIGALCTGNYIENDWRYTYSAPFTDHETFVLFLLYACVIAAVVGIILVIFSITKKRNQDALSRIQNTTNDGTQNAVCPRCGLNLAEGVTVCPKCGEHPNKTPKG